MTEDGRQMTKGGENRGSGDQGIRLQGISAPGDQDSEDGGWGEGLVLQLSYCEACVVSAEA